MPVHECRFSADALRHRRKARQVSRAELAVAVGITPDTIGNYERGETVPTVDTALKMAAHLGCGLAELFEDVERD